ncbi:MAG: hypothetical protein J0M02_12210 [Planctomycetes bacterium]|nr:hypothetical protein [Planctomycetota bacterium]
MPALLILVLTFLAPVVGGLLLAVVQTFAYRALRRDAPPFFILFARGLLLFFAIAAILAVAMRATAP